MDLQKMIIYDLRKLARQLGLTPLTRKKAELIEMIEKQRSNPAELKKSRQGRPPADTVPPRNDYDKQYRQIVNALAQKIDATILELQKLRKQL